MKITIDLTKEQDKKVELYKAENSFNSKAEAIADMITNFPFKVEVSK